MATSPDPVQPGSTQRGWLEQMARNPRPSAMVLFVISAALLAIPVYMGIQYKREYLNICLWGGAMAVLALGAGLVQLLRKPTTQEAPPTAV